MQYAIVAVAWFLLALVLWNRHRNTYGRHAHIPRKPARTLKERFARTDPDDLLGRSMKTCVNAGCAVTIHVFSDVCRHCGGWQPMQDEVETLRISVADARVPAKSKQEA